MIFTVPDLREEREDYEDGKEDESVVVPGTPSATFSRCKNNARSPSPSGQKGISHSTSTVSIDSFLGKNDIDDLSETDDESEWQENAKATHF